MPNIADKSQNIRIMENCEQLAFNKGLSIDQFEIISTQKFFETLMKDNIVENQTANFSDRVYIERLDENSLRQTLMNALAEDKNMLQKYHSGQDALYVIVFDRCVPGRVHRKQWNADWRVLPNLENWILYFKSNQNNLDNKNYYQIDYEKIQNMHEKIKFIYPSDKSVIQVSKFNIGSKNMVRSKASKLGLTFSVQENELNNSILNAVFSNKSRVIAELNEQNDVTATLTIKEGLVLSFSVNGDVSQSYKYAYKIRNQEISRLVTGQGSVIRFFENGNKEILFANGNFSTFNGEVWTNTNNKGYRKSKNGTSEWQIEPVPSAKYTDQKTGTRILQREDDVVLIEYKDGSLFTQHHDGTKIFTNAAKTQIIVEHNDYATVSIANEGTNTFIPNGSIVSVNKNNNIILQVDKNSINIHKNGSIKISNDDSDQIYEANLQQNNLFIHDNEGNQFKIGSNGDLEIIQPIIDQFYQSQDEGQRPRTPEFDEEEYYDPLLLQFQQNENLDARLFVINNDNQGYELLNENQLSEYFYSFQNDSIGLLKNKNIKGYQNSTEIIGVKNIKMFKELNKTRIVCDYPIQSLNTEQLKSQDIFEIRNFLHYQQLNVDYFIENTHIYEQWKVIHKQSQNEFGFLTRDGQEFKKAKEIAYSIIKLRQQDFHQEKFSEFVDSDRVQKYINKYKQDIKLQQFNQEQAKIVKVEPKKQKMVEKKYKDIVFEHVNKYHKQMDSSSLEYERRKDVFVKNYFDTNEGDDALRVLVIPPIPPKKRKILMSSEQHSQNQQSLAEEKENTQEEDNTNIVKIDAEQVHRSNEELVQQELKASVFQREDENEIQREFGKITEAEMYHKQKNQQYDVYGLSERKNKQRVPVLQRSNPQAEINQKFILTESTVERKTKISSLSNRLYFKSPAIQELRNQGLHQTMVQAIDKKNNIEDLIEKKNFMITAEIADKLKRNLLILPVKANFGSLRLGDVYELEITIKNEDILAQRITLKAPSTKYVKIIQKQTGPIALGMNREIAVRINACSNILGEFTDQFQILSKHEIYTIPVTARILDQNTFDNLDIENQKTSRKPLLKSYVRELNHRDNENRNTTGFQQSNTSDKLPRLQQYDKNIKLDPYGYKFNKTEQSQDQSQL